ncbi:MAG TPA: peptidylprolyl isomerase [Burkholderiaceae bacterium]|nr:peptidylprolyl isomerase [Burkholderiaceae bacterium]
MKSAKFLAATLAAAAFSVAAQTPAPRVAFDTSEGKIVVELAPQAAPKTVDNFLSYVKSGHYDGTVFHRVIPGFMIQGGGFTADMKEKATRGTIPLESRNGLKNERGTLAMARRGDPDSASAQFFINLVDNARLDYPNPDGNGYAVFGKVVEGMDVVDKIRAAPTDSRGPHQNVPVTPITIKTARVVK